MRSSNALVFSRSIGLPALAFVLVLAFALIAACPGKARAQDSTVFVDDFQSFNVGTMATGCGAMTANFWRWDSRNYYACYSAGWGVDYQTTMSSATPTDKRLLLWGGVPYGGGGDCTATLSRADFQELADYTITVRVAPVRAIDGFYACKRGLVGVAGRVQGTCAFCSGYLLALVLSNGESLCGQGSLLQLLRNERGPGCNGSEAMTVLASEPVDIAADPSGQFDPFETYVLKLCFSGSDIYGGVWASGDWQDGEGRPLAEVAVTDETYGTGTFGLYQSSARAGFDDVKVVTGSDCATASQDGLAASLDFDPDTLNLKSKGRYVTCYVELAEGYDPWDIDLGSVVLNGAVAAEMRPTDVSDYDRDGVYERMIKFSRPDVIALASSGADSLEVRVSGLLADGTAFEAKDTIRVIDPGGSASSSDAAPLLTATPTLVEDKTQIAFELAFEGHVSLSVYDAAGRMVRKLVDDYRGAGLHDVTWDRTDNSGRRVPAGVYFIRANQLGRSSGQKLMVVK